MKVGVLGASGFIGHRIVERLQMDRIDVCPIVRSEASLSRLEQSGLLDYRIANAYRIADAFDRDALQRAFSGCEVIVHSITGNPGLIRGSIAPAYAAAERAGVRRLIYLSSMCVHGQAPAPGTHEDTPLSRENQPFPYNTAKIDAERSLLRLRARGRVEVVIFRPGIVFGPRSPRVLEIADQLLHGTAYLVNGGRGVCNTTYVDNLVHAIELALDCEAADGEAFFVGEPEFVTWLDFYGLLAEALGVDPDHLPIVAPPAPVGHSRKQQVISAIRDAVVMQKLLASIPAEFKQTLKQTLRGRKRTASIPPLYPQRVVTQEMALLHQSPYRLPYDKAERLLGYTPIASFPDACRQTTDWLRQRWPVVSQQRSAPSR